MSGKQVNIVFRGVDEALYLDEAFWESSWLLKAVNHFCKNVPSELFN